MPEVVVVYIGLGSNLEKPIEQVQSALRELDDLAQTRLLQRSNLYCSDPMGPADQPDYINAVAAVETSLSPDELLSELQKLEAAHQRIRKERWGPRTLDLDLLLYGDQCISSEHLIVPHPGLSERNFVLIPLFEIAPNLILPDNRPLSDLIASCSNEGLQRLENE